MEAKLNSYPLISCSNGDHEEARSRQRCHENDVSRNSEPLPDGDGRSDSENPFKTEQAAIRQVNSGNTPDRGISHRVGSGVLAPQYVLH